MKVIVLCVLVVRQHKIPDTPNPTVTLYIADLADPRNIHTKEVKPPPIIEHINSTEYIQDKILKYLAELNVVTCLQALVL
ncbi:hypothetical protein TSAR_006765 [Trichomalopsis sarcophagae]|uniref:Uncharacterized protein n=1 Tax=Trichomalopsis sarcophagae TaxID=543379 RepID=A0A232FN25_9HYME|nr:hypothetical protein TSAR_006765 [Trichomalopsis sarcophagae]